MRIFSQQSFNKDPVLYFDRGRDLVHFARWPQPSVRIFSQQSFNKRPCTLLIDRGRDLRLRAGRNRRTGPGALARWPQPSVRIFSQQSFNKDPVLYLLTEDGTWCTLRAGRNRR
ncbi:hypothetical protein EVAR_103695_1 [Eumeta japonica]|uniref:Uncharacterized protein n=1 Tax=Eumeta variegata TaxID=151549 RepID=A0A4C1ZUX9_EUMVA|nr:hypothetical protein EVAR_103695_1 [Eumeta japonica]